MSTRENIRLIARAPYRTLEILNFHPCILLSACLCVSVHLSHFSSNEPDQDLICLTL